MKKLKFILLLSIVIALIMTFNACSESVAIAPSFDAVLNADYKPQVEKAENVAEIKELSGYQFLEAKGEFMVFVKGDADTGIGKAVFSTRNKRVVYVSEPTFSESVDITLTSTICAFTVTRTRFIANEEYDLHEVSDVSCELYDSTGALVAQIKGASAKPVMFADTVLFNRVSYSVNSENGSLSKISEIPENLYIEDCSDWNDEYFYTYGETVNVYNRNFKHVYSWTIPSWGDYLSKNVLNDGSVLVQYTRPLDNNAEEYDLYEMVESTGEVKKLDVYSVLLDPNNRSERELKLDYIVNQITTTDELLRASEGNGIYRDDIENIAYIYKIVDQQIDYSDASADIVLMDNKGKIKKSLKIVESQKAALPTCIGENVYVVPTAYGSAIIDINGNVLNQITNNIVQTVGENIVSEDVIYTLGMEEVYSLYDNSAEIMTRLNGTLFLKKESDDGYKIIAIRGNEQKEIFAYNAASTETVYFDELEDVGCYALCNVTQGEYRYYNSMHELLYTSQYRLDKVATDYGSYVSVYSTTVENENKFYAIY